MASRKVSKRRTVEEHQKNLMQQFATAYEGLTSGLHGITITRSLACRLKAFNNQFEDLSTTLTEIVSELESTGTLTTHAAELEEFERSVELEREFLRAFGPAIAAFSLSFTAPAEAGPSPQLAIPDTVPTGSSRPPSSCPHAPAVL